MGFKHNARDNTNSRIGKTTINPIRYDEHHIPPKKPDDTPRKIIVDRRHHRAYHLLFANAKSFEDAVAILLRDWWS